MSQPRDTKIAAFRMLKKL